jgi:nitrite reductase (NADH) small subunit/3-phenylpropionate/trans-cinnamate dioxygenase ferredoxin subunit
MYRLHDRARATYQIRGITDRSAGTRRVNCSFPHTFLGNTTSAGAPNSMSDFESVGNISEFPEGQGRAVPVDGRMVAVFRQGDTFYAIDDLCPHMGASLAEGFLEEQTVTCPWHAWRFCIKDGTWEDNPRVKVDAFEVRVEGDDVQVRAVPTNQDKD